MKLYKKPYKKPCQEQRKIIAQHQKSQPQSGLTLKIRMDEYALKLLLNLVQYPPG